MHERGRGVAGAKTDRVYAITIVTYDNLIVADGISEVAYAKTEVAGAISKVAEGRTIVAGRKTEGAGAIMMVARRLLNGVAGGMISGKWETGEVGEG